MKISVVTISFNQAKHLEKCIRSVAQQEGEWEHIIVDPGSTDGSRGIIEANRHLFSKVLLEPDDGPADGLNKGFSAATGDIGYFLNSDDFLLPNAFSTATKAFIDDPAIDVALLGGWIVDERDVPKREVMPVASDLASLLRGTSTIFQQGIFFRLSLLQEIGGFNPTNRTCWDFELLCDLVRKSRGAKCIRKRVAAFRVYKGSISDQAKAGSFQDRYALERRRILNSHGVRLNKEGKYSCFLRTIERHIRHPWYIQEKIERYLIFNARATKWRRDNGW